MTGKIDNQRPDAPQGLYKQQDTVARYIHEYLPACRISEERGLFGVGAPQEVADQYPDGRIEEHLNQRAKAGWRLICMEPHWYYERQYISLAMSITKPLAIIGWYLTFEGLGIDNPDSSRRTDPSRSTTITGRAISGSMSCPTCGNDIETAGIVGQDNRVQCDNCGDEWSFRPST